MHPYRPVFRRPNFLEVGCVEREDDACAAVKAETAVARTGPAVLAEAVAGGRTLSLYFCSFINSCTSAD